MNPVGMLYNNCLKENINISMSVIASLIESIIRNSSTSKTVVKWMERLPESLKSVVRSSSRVMKIDIKILYLLYIRH